MKVRSDPAPCTPSPLQHPSGVEQTERRDRARRPTEVESQRRIKTHKEERNEGTSANAASERMEHAEQKDLGTIDVK